jgi:hypothetical protein
MTARTRFAFAALGCLSALSLSLVAQQEYADPSFDTSIATPAYTRGGPIVAIDAAHRNRHSADGSYKPLAELLGNDGYTVVSLSTAPFDARMLGEIDVLVMANPLDLDAEQAVDDEEADSIRDWVAQGGSLLLITDLPWNLADRFGVATGKGLVFDRDGERRLTTLLTFSRENRLLGDHPIIHGRDASEAVARVATFTGQSIGVPAGALALMRLSDTARETNNLGAEQLAFYNDSALFGAHSASVAGRAQAIAMIYGTGRVVVLGDAAMLEARLHLHDDGHVREGRVGMNVTGNDNRQFALNVFHWLSRLID